MSLERVWAVVLNATRARILRDLQEWPRDVPTELVMRAPNRHLRDIMANPSGRGLPPGRPGRSFSIPDGPDRIRADQREFLEQVVSVLETHRVAGDFDRLVLFSEPDMLGLLRAEMPPRLAARVIGEFAGNFLHLSPHDLPVAIVRELEGGLA